MVALLPKLGKVYPNCITPVVTPRGPENNPPIIVFNFNGTCAMLEPFSGGTVPHKEPWMVPSNPLNSILPVQRIRLEQSELTEPRRNCVKVSAHSSTKH